MNYNETIDYLFNALPAYQNIGSAAYKENIDNTVALLDVLDQPHQKFKSIHVAGTNGKGSVSHALAAIFQACGYKTGLYTSPHLLDFRERIRVNGQEISEQDVIDFTQTNKEHFEAIKPSFFEMTVGMAFNYFAKQEVDIAIIETGLGGRLDSTNIIQPEASIITNISMDHANILGDTLEAIAGEKAGIIKKDTPVILGDIAKNLLPIFSTKAAENNSPLTLALTKVKTVSQKGNKQYQNITFNQNGKYFAIDTDLRGKYQAHNIATALATIDVIAEQGHFEFDDKTIKKALLNVIKTTGLRGRWDTLKTGPLFITDTGHNLAGISILMEQITALPHSHKIVIYGCVDDKDMNEILPLFDKDCHYIFTKSQNKRALDENLLLEKAQELGLKCVAAPTVDDALLKAYRSSEREDVIIACGSTFIVAEVMDGL